MKKVIEGSMEYGPVLSSAAIIFYHIFNIVNTICFCVEIYWSFDIDYERNTTLMFLYYSVMLVLGLCPVILHYLHLRVIKPWLEDVVPVHVDITSVQTKNMSVIHSIAFLVTFTFNGEEKQLLYDPTVKDSEKADLRKTPRNYSGMWHFCSKYHDAYYSPKYNQILFLKEKRK